MAETMSPFAARRALTAFARLVPVYTHTHIHTYIQRRVVVGRSDHTRTGEMARMTCVIAWFE